MPPVLPCAFLVDRDCCENLSSFFGKNIGYTAHTVGTFCFGIAFLRKYKANAYRRAGIALVENAKTARELSVILKRVALVSFDRESVASLYGKEWIKFLNASCAGVDLVELESSGRSELNQGLRSQGKRWIKEHKVC